MGYTERQDARSHDSVTTFDSTTLSAGAYTASATLGCNDELVAFLVAVKGAGAWVQGAASASASGGSATAVQAFPGGNTLGNCIIVDASMSGLFGPAGTTAVCTDSQGNSYTQVIDGAVGGGNLIAFSFIAFGVRAGANTVTVTFTPGFSDPPGPVTIAVNEHAGGTAVDVSTGAAGASANVYNLSLTTTAPHDLLHLAIVIAAACAGSPFAVGGGNPLTPPTPPQAWLIVNEPSLGFTDRSSFLFMDGGQHSFDLKLRERGTANYTLVSNPQDPTSAPISYLPTMGQPIYLYDQNVSGYALVFAGLIQDYTIRWSGITGLRYIDVSAVSLESVFDTVYAQPMQFVNQTCGAILTALFNAFENGCPVTLGLVQAGATAPLFNAQLGDKLSDLFDQLATTSKFTWGVNPQTQQLFFQLPTATPAPFTIQSANVLWDSISQKFDNADYRNRQAVKLSFDAFPHSQEGFVGAGQQTFTLMRPVEQVTGAWVTTSTPNTATAAFSGQPSPGDTFSVGPAQGAWQAAHIYGLAGVIVVAGIVFKVTTAGTSGGTQPAGFLTQTVVGDTVNDNTVIWTCQGPAGLGTGFTTYTWVSALDNTQYGQVLIGGTLAASVQNAVDALNATAPYGGTPATKGKGLTISLPTWENSQVNAISVTGTGFTVTQKIPGSGWIAGLTSTGTAFSWSAVTTSGGTSPQTAVGPNEPATLSISVYAVGTSNSAPGLSYTEGSAVVQLATPLNSGTNLTVEYTRTDGNVIEVENTAAVTALAAISHGTGKYQQATDQSSTGLISTDAAAGLQFAQQILATFDITQQKFELQLYQPGITPGQVLTLALNSPLNVMNGSYLVLSIKGELVPTFPYLDNPNAPNAGHYRYTADLINVNLIGTDLAFWLGLGGGGGSGGSGGGELVATSGGGVPNAGPLGPTPLTSGGVNIQTTSYTAVAADNGKIISVNAAGATTLTLPAAPPFAQWNIFVENIGAGTLTVSPNGLNLDGSASSITVGTNQGTYISTDGTNYFTGSRGFGLTNPMTTKGDVIVGATSGVPARLAVGANGKVITANSAATNGVDYEAPIALTTTGTSGAASLTPGNPYTLNVPQYSGGGGGLTLIQSQVLGSPAASVTFSAIPGTFTHLRLVFTARSSVSGNNDNFYVQMNGDTAANYNAAFNIANTGGNASGAIGTGATAGLIGTADGATSPANSAASGEVLFPSYARTTFSKRFTSTFGDIQGASLTNVFVRVYSGVWNSTAAITSLLIQLSSGSNFVTGSAFDLYGF